MTYVLAIDQGTSGTKAIVVDEAGQVAVIAEIAAAPGLPARRRRRARPRRALASVVEAGRRALDRGRVTVSAVALANQGETVLAWDRAHRAAAHPGDRLAGPPRRAICAALADPPTRSPPRTGLVLDPYFSAPKMAWIRENLTRDGVVTTTDTWLIHRLCGAFVTDVSTASRSLLLDLDTATGTPICSNCSAWPTRSCPTIVDCDHIVGDDQRHSARRHRRSPG